MSGRPKCGEKKVILHEHFRRNYSKTLRKFRSGFGKNKNPRIRLEPSKCKYLKPELEYLGHVGWSKTQPREIKCSTEL